MKFAGHKDVFHFLTYYFPENFMQGKKKALGSVPWAFKNKKPRVASHVHPGCCQLFASAVRMDASKNKKEASRFNCDVCACNHINFPDLCSFREGLLQYKMVVNHKKSFAAL